MFGPPGQWVTTGKTKLRNYVDEDADYADSAA